MGILNYTTQKINEILGKADRVTNQNLLDNWYFGNPVNQRGLTTKSGAGYFIDRWHAKSENISCEVVQGGVKLTNAGTGAATWRQEFEIPLEAGREYTVSAVYSQEVGASSGSIRFNDNGIHAAYFSSDVADHSLVTKTFTASVALNYIAIRVPNGGAVTIHAIKLELGSQQTLAHQENGTWVLNEVPNYATELLKCQRYFTVLKSPSNYSEVLFNGMISTATTARFYATLPVEMKPGSASVTKKLLESAYKIYSNGSSYAINSESMYTRGNRLYVNAVSSGMEPHHAAVITCSGPESGVDGEIWISKEL